MLTKSLRKLTLTSHVTSSVGWLGAVVAYLAVAGLGLTSQNEQLARAAYLMTDVIIRFVIVPFSFAAVLTGLVQSLGTEWGLFRHYWVATKFVLSVVATIILLIHMQAVTRMSSLAASESIADLGTMRLQMVVHAAGGLIVLLAATVLSIYKPWGRTKYGRKKEEGADTPVRASTVVIYLLISAAALFVLLHLFGGMRLH